MAILEKSRRAENAEATREALVDEAAKLFVRQGFNGTSLDDIAAKARVTKGALYHHFKNKADLYAACYERQAAFVAECIAKVDHTDDPWADAMNQCRAFMDIATTRGLKTIPIQEAMTVLGYKRWRELDAAHTMGAVTETVERLKRADILKDLDTRLTADMIYGLLVNGMMTLSMSKDRAEAKTELLTLVDRMFTGLRAT